MRVAAQPAEKLVDEDTLFTDGHRRMGRSL